MSRKDCIKEEITNFAEVHHWIVKRANGGYALYDEESFSPIVRLKSVANGEFEIQEWDLNWKRWRAFSNPPCILPLEDALEFIKT
jgi:hypothetical protein